MKLSRQLLVIHSVIIALLVIGYAWLSLLNIRQLTIQELLNQSNTAVHYLVEPLQNAVIEQDYVVYQTKIDTFYDSGNYSRISLYGAENFKPVMYERRNLEHTADVPGWFVRLFPVEPIIGQKEMYKGLEKVALLEVQIHPFAFYQFVWRQFVDMLSVTVFVGLVAWALGFALINIVLQPIMAVKRQASAVTNKHFPQITTHSGIAEFEQLIEVHNEMTRQVKVLFSQQQQHLDELKHDLYHETSSGLANREYFQITLSDLLNRKAERLMGGLVIIQLYNASKLRHEEGFSAYQDVVEEVVKTVERVSGINKNSALFQLNEQDFALLLLHQGTSEILEYSKTIGRQLDDCELLQKHGGAFLGASEIIESDTPESLKKRADEALRYAIDHDKHFYMDKTNGESNRNARFKSKQELLNAVERARVEFYRQPVVDPISQQLLFTELYTKLALDDEELSLPSVLVLAEKYEVTTELDKKILSELQKHYLLGALQGKISINVSAFSFHSKEFQTWLFNWLKEAQSLASNLIMEFDEIDLSHTPQAREISFKLANNGVQVAIDHFGRGSSSLSRFSDMKLHWLKIDSRYIQRENTASNRDYLKMISELVEKLGVSAIIPNIETEEQLTLAKEVGCSGVQGFLIAKPKSIFED
ncbi:EAL domain-containing protein [Psychrosphaera ytuae]|uniref:EAL domain-containing protein n=1 Tax=Psychrosphaera ytuae TaxID=2820710 RepID=A0A975HHE6_9GAMM|nr:bifunctional diguanylate cyclase/phosphodiesterase [Psychrosphaera ytuae]QTH63030.1 EAL domain-containing protein [Psychrosphaera ytuae]